MVLSDLIHKISSYKNLIIHTDVTKGFKTRDIINKNDFLEFHFQKIRFLSGNAQLFFPAFNYDFCDNGIFDLSRDKIQVGILNEYLRITKFKYRLKIPVFSFISEMPFEIRTNKEKAIDPFDMNSFFGYAYKNNFGILHYGSTIASSTLIHFAERISNRLLYRYDKIFNGEIIENNLKSSISINYHVRPLDLNLTYDWYRIKNDLINKNLYHEHNQGRLLISIFPVKQTVDFWIDNLSINPFYFLDDLSKSRVIKLINVNNPKLTINQFE